jgi:hypothetical protein
LEELGFFMWLVTHNKCWMVDPLARRGLQYPPRCPLCDQEGETINYLLVACVYSRQFWFGLLQRVGLLNLSPQSRVFLRWLIESMKGWSGRFGTV